MNRLPRLRAALGRARGVVAAEWRHLTTLTASERPLAMPLAAALATGLPIFIGAAAGHLGNGLVASLGGLVFLYLPGTPLAHRMAWLMACAFGLVACYTLGVLSHLYAPLTLPLLTLITIAVTMVCRFYAVPPPGGLFFVMAAAIGAYTPSSLREAQTHIGLLTMGCVLGVVIAFAYSLLRLRRAPPVPAPPLRPDFDFVVVDAVVIGAFVGLSLALAQLLQLPRPYWVPVSCLSVIQGVSLRAVWVRQFHRILGTAAGLAVFGALATLSLGDWGIAALLTLLAFIVETLVVRHYGLAVVFITPMTILLAEAAQLGSQPPEALMMARLVDTVVGCAVGLAGGMCLHNARFRAVVGAALRKAVPRYSGL
ncbi:FUSC family protein [Ramlibacter sp. MAHUQ-53]|uniref:FUSC family protein n=1 Tax=unclassified Ramlibacter TaxID=2617605 RepID=UPI003635C4F9